MHLLSQRVRQLITKCWIMLPKGKAAHSKVLDHVAQVQALYPCHCSRRDDIMQQLKDRSYAYMQLAVDK